MHEPAGYLSRSAEIFLGSVEKTYLEADVINLCQTIDAGSAHNPKSRIGDQDCL